MKTDCADKGEPAFEIEISVPQPIVFDEWFIIKFSIRNTGKAGAYFRIPWTCEPTETLLQAKDENGKVYKSVQTRGIKKPDCTYLKPMDPAGTYTFEWAFIPPGKFDETPCTIGFPKPGKYRMKWIYNPEHLEEHDRCAIGGWPIWKKPLESPEIEVIVLPNNKAIKSIKSK